jgi:hypothetical protein
LSSAGFVADTRFLLQPMIAIARAATAASRIMLNWFDVMAISLTLVDASGSGRASDPGANQMRRN